jgi:hypothetical protein
MGDMIDKGKLLEWLHEKDKESVENAENLLHSAYYQGRADAFTDVIEDIESDTFDIPYRTEEVERFRIALEEIRTTIKGTYEETTIERRKIAEIALGYMPQRKEQTHENS